MNSASENTGTLRLFFAFELSVDVRDLAATTQAGLIGRLGTRELRWSHPVDMHVTALFLGNHSNVSLPTFEAAAAGAVQSTTPFDLSVGGLGRFPEHGPPRVVWLGGREGSDRPASALVARLRAELPNIGLDDKPFKPHITLGYVRPTADRQAVDAALQNTPIPAERTLTVSRLVLMQTILEAEKRNSAGARYNIVQAFPFCAQFPPADIANSHCT